MVLFRSSFKGFQSRSTGRSCFAVLTFILTSFTVSVASAGDFKWSGGYRFEGLTMANSEASSENGLTKSYMLHHLILKPEIVAYDGLVIRSRFDIMNNSQYPNSQLGQNIGSSNGLGGATSTSTSGQNSAVLSKNQAVDSIGVTEAYAVWSQEFGALTVGRAPIHFGLGMMFNAGRGAFDHWLNNRDLVAVKIVSGNLFVMPVIAKVREGSLNQNDDVNDIIIHGQYQNPETDLTLGLFYQARRSGSGADSNDAPLPVFGGIQSGNYEVDFYNFFISQWVNRIKIGLEVGFADGNTGLSTGPGGPEIAHTGLGAAVKVEYLPEASPWSATLDLGYASGDDPATDANYEGYIFDRNFDIAFIMFNHMTGQYDMLRTNYINAGNASSGTPGARPPASSTYDIEAISNALYTSVGATYKWAEKYSFSTQLTYGQLNKDPLNTDVDSSLGFEVDLTLGYQPIEGFQWITRAGLLSPGGAYRGGSANGFATDMIYGLETKAAISF